MRDLQDLELDVLRKDCALYNGRVSARGGKCTHPRKRFLLILVFFSISDMLRHGGGCNGADYG